MFTVQISCVNTPLLSLYIFKGEFISILGKQRNQSSTVVNRISCSSQSRVVGGWVVVGDGQVMSDYKVITKPQLMYRQNWKLPLITFSVHGRLETGELFNRKYFNRL